MTIFSSGRKSYSSSYDQILKDYRAKLGTTVEMIDEIMLWHKASHVSPNDYVRFQHIVHSLAGSGGVFGFKEISNCGRSLDLFLDGLFVHGFAVFTPDESKTFKQLVANLRSACLNASQEDSWKNEGRRASPQRYFSTGKKHERRYVMIVDDDQYLSDFLGMKLNQNGIDVICAQDCKTALKLLERQMPDLIIVDLMIPDGSGHDILCHLQQDPELSQIPALVLSGNNQVGEIQNAIQNGAIDFIAKPFDPDQLVERLRMILDVSCYTILIADDDPIILALLQNEFRHRGFKVLVTRDGAQAWSSIFKNAPDLVILDRKMPGIDGMNVLMNMRQEESTRKTPVIMFSAYANDQQAIDNGAQVYVSKPTHPADIIARSLNLLMQN